MKLNIETHNDYYYERIELNEDEKIQCYNKDNRLSNILYSDIKHLLTITVMRNLEDKHIIAIDLYINNRFQGSLYEIKNYYIESWR